jgi:BirA family transcriptional regulator, biotin operon repressor / biotin---[acetyl-CoA-carboxylase] ligase
VSDEPQWIIEARSATVGGRFDQIEWVAETGSTNADLVARAGGPSWSDVVLVADHQTAGRGRLARQWVAPPAENLLVSVLTTPRCDPGRWPLVTTAMGIAAAEVADAFGVAQVGLRWPNDVIVGGAAPGKLAGVLAELVLDAGAPSAVVVGVGLNVGWPVADDARASLGATSMVACTDAPVDRGAVLAALMDRFAAVLAVVESDPAQLRELHLARSVTVGRVVRIARPDSTQIEGEAVDIDESGRIVVRLDGRHHAFSAGDVTHLR